MRLQRRLSPGARIPTETPMTARLFALRRVAVGLAALLSSAATLEAQLISPKTVPIHQGEQFGIYPAQWPGMGGVSIALVDTIGDPWSNPAKATRLTVGSIQVMPFTHRATAGGGRTLPVSILQTGGGFAGGALFSLQEVERRDVWWNLPIADRRASNQYLSGVLGRRFGSGLSVGAAVSFADLRGVDGVGALYGGSDRVRQSGGWFDARLGLTREFTGGSTLEVVALSNRYRMDHDVHFPATWRWTPCAACPVGQPCECRQQVQVPDRDEKNLDRTNTAGLHAVFLTPRTDGGWRMGYMVTANRLSHPKIPNYVLQNIPRDPGNTDAFNLGFGTSRQVGPSTFGLDVVMEPMWSRTWADAAGDTTDAMGSVIPQGAHTVDNQFRFSNSRINVGYGHEFPGNADSTTMVGLQFGVSMRSINYTLDQTNHVQRTSRTQDEGWTEWTPTFAARVRTNDIVFSYSVSMTCGPSCNFPGGTNVARNFNNPDASGPPVVAAPESPLTFDGGSSSHHRVMVSIRLR
jgi:hypothetical protein